MRIIIMWALLATVSVCHTVNYAYAESLDKKFTDIRHDTPRLTAVLYDFPKGADLHNHASGAYFMEYILIFAAENDYYYDLENLQIVDKIGSGGKLIPVKKLLTRKADLRDFLDVVSSRGWFENTLNGSDHFFSAFGRVQAEGWENEALARVIARNHDQGVRYIELMMGVVNSDLIKPLHDMAPAKDFDMKELQASYDKIKGYLDSPEFALGVNSGMKKIEEDVDAILKDKYGLTITGETPDIVVRFMPQLKRSTEPYGLFINASAYLKASQIDENIVAVNMVEVEAGLPSLMYFDDHMQILDFLWQAMGQPKIALHAGELVLRESPVEPMRSRISQSILKGHALRIGHGISIGWEEDVNGTLKMMKDKGIPVEICLSSNHMILDISGDDHPLDMYLEAGVPVTIATDDEGISRSILTMEYVKAAQEHGLNYTVLKEIAKNGLKYSFLKGDGIYEKNGAVKGKYKSRITAEKFPTIKQAGGIKAYLQIRHERDLAVFEKEVLNPL